MHAVPRLLIFVCLVQDVSELSTPFRFFLWPAIHVVVTLETEHQRENGHLLCSRLQQYDN